MSENNGKEEKNCSDRQPKSARQKIKKLYLKICIEIIHTRFARSRRGRHSPNAFTKVVMFFLGSGLARARIIGLRGLVKKRIIWIAS